MITRDSVISKAIEECMKELYSLATPSISWEDFIEENRIYREREKKWVPKENKISHIEYCGPKPFEFYYLPKEIMKDIVDSYIYSYKLDQKQELLDTIEILKNYCEDPIIDKYIKGENGNSGYKEYEHCDNLETELNQLFKEYFGDSETDPCYVGKEVQNKFFEFLDMAGKFFNWNSELNCFSTSIYLGASPNTNKEEVVENWKIYRNQDIEIDEEQIKKEYYGDDE